MNNQNNFKKAMKVSILSITSNILLSIFKFLAGIIGKSSAMISDSIHSLSDVLSTIVVMIGIKISNKKSDEDHQYGHERFECIASFILSIILFITGLGIGIDGAKKIFIGIDGNLEVPKNIALIAAIVSIVIKEIMYWITRNTAKKINSQALMADAWHHRSDAFSSIGSLIGIAGSKLGLPILDPIACVVICIFIIKVAVDILKDSTYKLVDKSCSEDMENGIKDIILNTEGVLGIDILKTRLFGSKIYVDIEISADKNLTLENAHEIASNVHDNLENQIKDIKHCMIHINPK